MISLAFVLLPAIAALCLGHPRLRAHATGLLLGTATVVSALALLQAGSPTISALPFAGGYLRVDATSRLFLALVNPIFFGVCVYVRSRVTTTPVVQRELGRFAPCALLLLAAVNAVLIANHLLVQWIALEVSALVVAPLIIRPGVSTTRLASWRYLLFSSVGLGLALLGFVCLMRGIEAGGAPPTFFLDRLDFVSAAAANRWGKLGLALVLLGLGTKLGLAPMYSWLPEAYDEAPPAVTALLAAVQFNAVLVVLLRVVHSFRPVHAGLIATELVAMGLVSLVVSTLGIIATRNLKRLVAYASISHAGVIAIALGGGRTASYGLLLYIISNAFIKAILFLTAGKIKAQYGTKDTRQIAGLLKDMPYSGVFLMVGTFALLGFPPFGSFFGELLILSALVSAGHLFVFATVGVLTTMTFVAVGRTIFPMIWGEPSQARTGPPQTLLSVAPKISFLAALVVLGLYIPPVVNNLIQQVSSTLEGP